jgi:hypothetical protein
MSALANSGQPKIPLSPIEKPRGAQSPLYPLSDIRRTPDRLKIRKILRGYVHPACRAAKRRVYCGTASNAGPVIAPGLRGDIQMPTKVNLELIMVWFCVGFFTGAGWAVAAWLVGRILGLTHL